ncbi:ATP-binding cassette domain-containing protein [Heyndrickxia coagulans]|uniref:ATP-binding cassette domain-containing protein n=1 Tax=Heyndrickxia coagulans TaxID=1398 RepID=UPI000A59944D|nr:ATP-binding cassette domain-containing protein [Heyndrickxia coagulans]
MPKINEIGKNLPTKVTKIYFMNNQLHLEIHTWENYLLPMFVRFSSRIQVKPNSHTAQKLLRHKIGFLFQNFALIDDKSVNYNLDLACVDKKRWDKNSKTQLLEKLQLDVSLNKKVYHLSGGEQQRLALARLIMKDCDFILADEPTGSLDQTNRNTVLDILSQLNHNGKTIVIVSHDPFVMERCQRVVNLNSPSKAEA